MQVRPPNAQSGFPAIPYHPPVAPAIHPHIGQLIPRIRIAIQDIDVFQNMVAQGVIDSSMPSWYVQDPCDISELTSGTRSSANTPSSWVV